MQRKFADSPALHQGQKVYMDALNIVLTAPQSVSRRRRVAAEPMLLCFLLTSLILFVKTSP